MIRSLVVSAALLGCAPGLWALQDADSKKDEAPKKDLKTLLADIKKAEQEFNDKVTKLGEKFQAASTDEEKQEIMKKFREMQGDRPNPADHADTLFELVNEDPKSEMSGEALAWLAGQQGARSQSRKALELIKEHHIASKHIGPVCQSMMYNRSSSAKEFLKEVLAKNPHKEPQALACFALARQAKGEEAEKLYERIVNEFSDVTLANGRMRLADMAEGQLFVLRNLSIGKTAPDIVGEDTDGVEFKLSDYRGKVVVIDFWGHW